MTMWRVVALCALVAAGCGDDTVVPVPPLDLGVLDDLGGPPDLLQMCPSVWDLSARTPFCAGTSVAGTCVQAFFQPIVDCLVAAGPCSCSKDNVCNWVSGARSSLGAPDDAGLDGTLTHCGTVCARFEGYMSSIWRAPDGTTLTIFSPPSSLALQATCPDGTQVTFESYDCPFPVEIAGFVEGDCTHP
jgi:hypothetical protein